MYHAALGQNVTVSYTVVDTGGLNGIWKIAVDAKAGDVEENAYDITTKSILPVGGSKIIGEIDRLEVATKMPVAEFLMGITDQPLVVGASWHMEFLTPDNTFTRSSIIKQ